MDRFRKRDLTCLQRLALDKNFSWFDFIFLLVIAMVLILMLIYAGYPN